MGGLGNGWVQMGRSVVGGFGWADHHPPHSGCNGLMLVGYGSRWANFHGL